MMRLAPNQSATSKFDIFLIITPLLFFALPLGMPTDIAQPVTAILLLPITLRAIRSNYLALAFIAIATATSINRATNTNGDEIPYFQFIRGALPFFYTILLLSNYEKLTSLTAVRLRSVTPKFLERIPFWFGVGQLIQLLLFSFFHAFANLSLFSDETNRLFLYPHSSSLILYHYSLINNRYLLLCMTTFVLLASGSKTDLVCMVVLFALAIILSFSTLRRLLTQILSALIFLTAVVFVNPTALQRSTDFYYGDDQHDLTREWEISYASSAFYSSVYTIIFGSGLASPLTPGVQSIDPRWTENSRYDIENGFWALLAKTGLIGFSVFSLTLVRLPINSITLALVIIEAVTAFASSGLLFTNFDGTLLIMWSLYLCSTSILNQHVNFPFSRVNRRTLPLESLPVHQPLIISKPDI